MPEDPTDSTDAEPQEATHGPPDDVIEDLKKMGIVT